MVVNRRISITSLFTYLIILLLLSFPQQALSKSEMMQKYSYSLDDLPSMIIAYDFINGHYPDFKCLWDKDKEPFLLQKLDSSFERMSCNIGTRMALTYLSFIIQSNIDNQKAGFLSKDEPYDSILFVTTPIESFGNKVLVILSSVSPQRTTIMSIDKELNVNLLYDSFKRGLNIYYPLPQITSINVKRKGVFELTERTEKRPKGIPETKRNITIDVSSNIFHLKVGAYKIVRDIKKLPR